MCVEVYPFTHLFCHKYVWRNWKLIPFSKALPGGRSAREWISEMTHSPGHLLCLCVCCCLLFIKLRQRLNLLCAVVSRKKKACDIAKAISPCCSLSPVQCTSYTQNSPACHCGSQGKDQGCFTFQPPARKSFGIPTLRSASVPWPPVKPRAVVRPKTQSFLFGWWWRTEITTDGEEKEVSKTNHSPCAEINT